MQAFFISTGLVALAEIGDKTQLLAFMLAARWRKPWPIIAGIFAATLVNHAGASALGDFLSVQIGPGVLRWLLGLGFVLMAVWMLIPDKLEDADAAPRSNAGVFMSTLVAFFMAEMGDKTQVATIALAARFHTILPVLAGTTLGMMIANVPAVLIGERLAGKVPLPLVHGIAAVVLLVLGVITLWFS